MGEYLSTMLERQEKEKEKEGESEPENPSCFSPHLLGSSQPGLALCEGEAFRLFQS